MSDRIRLGVIGLGAAGKGHLETALGLGDFEVVGAADPAPENIPPSCSARGLRVYSDHQLLLEHEDLDAVFVASPHPCHYEQTLAALEADCHVLVEKPMAMTVDQCTEMIETARRRRKQLMVAHTLHYYPSMRYAKALIDQGRIGRALVGMDLRCADYVTSERPAWYLEGQAHGMFFNLGVHGIDRLRWLLGSDETTVLAKLSMQGPIDLGGTALITYASGASATITMSGYGAKNPSTVMIFGEEGVIRARFDSVELDSGGDFVPLAIPETNPPGVSQLIEFRDSIREGRPAETDGLWGCAVVAVAVAVYQSHQTGQTISVEKTYSP